MKNHLIITCWLIGCIYISGAKPLKACSIYDTDSSGKAKHSNDNFTPDFTNTLTYDFFSTINGISYENKEFSTQHNEFNFQYNFSINNSFQTKKFTIRSYCFNEYGFRYFPDSISTKGPDNLQIRNTLQIPVGKKIKTNIGFTMKTQLWKQFEYRETILGNQEKYLYSDYFSPGYFIYNAGITFNFLEGSTLDIGLIGGKTTRIKNQQIFEDRQANKLYGLQKGERKKISYGLSMQLNIPPQKFGKHIGWESTASLFATKEQLGRLAGYALEANNVLHYIFLRNLRISWRSSTHYDEQISADVFWMNSISLGFYLSNKL